MTLILRACFASLLLRFCCADSLHEDEHAELSSLASDDDCGDAGNCALSALQLQSGKVAASAGWYKLHFSNENASQQDSPALRLEAPPASCGAYGCSLHYVPTHACQCNAKCRGFGNCCSDFGSLCQSPPPLPPSPPIPTTTTTTASAPFCMNPHEQCGGLVWDGSTLTKWMRSTCCNDGYSCQERQENISQCHTVVVNETVCEEEEDTSSDSVQSNTTEGENTSNGSVQSNTTEGENTKALNHSDENNTGNGSEAVSFLASASVNASTNESSYTGHGNVSGDSRAGTTSKVEHPNASRNGPRIRCREVPQASRVCTSKLIDQPRCSPVIKNTSVPALNVTGTSLDKPSNAPILTFYMYRAEGAESYPLSNVNMANLPGVMWYLHNEIVGRGDWGGKRKFNKTRIVRYKVSTRATQPLWEQGMNFGVRYAFDSGQCTGPFDCNSMFQKYGFFVGCNVLSDRAGWPFPNFPVQYADGIWYSLPGACPQKHYWDEDDLCLAAQPGGLCEGVPTGMYNCTYSYERAGEIGLDELENIVSFDRFITDGNREYDHNSDRGIGMTFWDGIHNTARNAWRVGIARDLFEKHYPNSSADGFEEPICDFSYDYFYGRRSCATATPGSACYNELLWAKQTGIRQHPEWYPGLHPDSSWKDFQKILASKPSTHCSIPCNE
eukprot:TRINITY_DN20923_c0_g1_i1.p1 TRINITY_DN20923_c0_g1~~TRINITY_DN20923_c0_g1_i1.p1  ORF type:complete len:669 (-),score=102.20 TRINITY_DN20923_c0_g1_i1:64-2070(-)